MIIPCSMIIPFVLRRKFSTRSWTWTPTIYRIYFQVQIVTKWSNNLTSKLKWNFYILQNCSCIYKYNDVTSNLSGFSIKILNNENNGDNDAYNEKSPSANNNNFCFLQNKHFHFYCIKLHKIPLKVTGMMKDREIHKLWGSRCENLVLRAAWICLRLSRAPGSARVWFPSSYWRNFPYEMLSNGQAKHTLWGGGGGLFVNSGFKYQMKLMYNSEFRE